jgi:hypothetical protein
VDSSVVGYDGGWNVRDEELSVGRKKLVRKAEPPAKRGIAWPRWTGFRGKTAWDWLQLLIVPLVLAVLGLSFALAQQVIGGLQQEVRQQQIEEHRAAAERQVAEQQAQDEALQAYLVVMKELLLEQDLRNSEPGSSARAVANVQTSLILERVDGNRKRMVLRLLMDSHLIDAEAPLIETSTLALQGADAKGMDLSDTDLSGADLSGAYLSDANLSDAVLLNVDLSNAVLDNANLRGAEGISNEQLEQQAYSLEGATMPNGQKYEDWLKSKGREENGKSGGSS